MTAPPDGAAATPGGRATERTRSWTIVLGSLLLRLLARTWRYQVREERFIQELRARRQPFLFACRHGQMLPLLWRHRHEGIALLVSEHRDGELIARIAESLGFRSVRGSTSRGGGRALLAIIHDLERGGVVAITPDGPRGPPGSFAPGVVIAAQRSGVPILPIAAAARRAWRLRSWDAFLIPKPFARVVVAYGEPRRVRAPSARQAVEEAPEFQALLDSVVARADA